MEEWKELDIANLPGDILVGDYEFEPYNHNSGVYDIHHEHLSVLLFSESAKRGEIRYRKRQQKQPTHEEIMTKWWKHDNGVWFRVLEYDSKSGDYLCNYENDDWVKSGYFTGRQSADIPPEDK